jgi:hypothetical protein
LKEVVIENRNHGFNPIAPGPCQLAESRIFLVILSHGSSSWGQVEEHPSKAQDSMIECSGDECWASVATVTPTSWDPSVRAESWRSFQTVNFPRKSPSSWCPGLSSSTQWPIHSSKGHRWLDSSWLCPPDKLFILLPRWGHWTRGRCFHGNIPLWVGSTNQRGSWLWRKEQSFQVCPLSLSPRMVKG